MPLERRAQHEAREQVRGWTRRRSFDTVGPVMRSLLACGSRLVAGLVVAGCGDRNAQPLEDPQALAESVSEHRVAPKQDPEREPTPPSLRFTGLATAEHTLAEQDAAGTSGPDDVSLALREIEVIPNDGTLGEGALTVRAKGLVRHPIGNATFVHAKAVCKVGARRLADTGYVNADYQHPLTDYRVGETVELEGALFGHGLPEDHGACQLELRLAGAGSGGSLPLATACFDAERTSEGACVPAVTGGPVAAGSGVPLAVHDLTALEQEGFGARGSLLARYVLEVLEPQDASVRITMKAACRVGGRKFVDVRMTNLIAGPFRYEVGESVARTASLFYNPAFGFQATPSPCDLEVSLWTRDDPQAGPSQPTVIHRACYRDGQTAPGTCETEGAGPQSAPRPATIEALTLGDVVMQVVEPVGGKGKRFQLKVQADATCVEPLDRFSNVTAKITCKVDNSARVETAYLYGVDLHHLSPGETTRMTSTTFTSNPMEDEPESCEAVFVAGRRFVPSGEENLELGRFCLRRGTTVPGGC